MRIFSGLYLLLAALLILSILSGCADPEDRLVDEYLIRVGKRITTIDDFKRTFEIVKAAYSHNALKSSAYLREARLSLLNQLVEQMIILERAREQNIGISDSEVEEVIAGIKKDYPEGEFDKTLLEYAISYQSWREALKNRLLIEKVIAEELEEKVVITPGIISEYYERNYDRFFLNSGSKEDSANINEFIIKHLRKEKVEEAYKDWIKELKKNYKIEINRERWEEIASS
ncbi:MAG: SurA N-terminal domain-containing protein [Desulfobacteraceae bacterium]|nr:SurA N-terminal domain-containing protein [Pseudomonadota bacterium]MCG2757636.1 SurA N-terminal domain-containing protein [Desulfobacteraceae bacterium]